MCQEGGAHAVGVGPSPTLLILVGPKGSGKTHIGTVVERRLGVRFLRVEPIFRAHKNAPGAMAEVEREIDRALAETGVVVIESTGAAPELVQYWRERYERVLLARVYASAETCLKRFQERDASTHIPVSDDRFHEINELAARASLDWDCVLDNERALTDEDIVRIVAATLETATLRQHPSTRSAARQALTVHTPVPPEFAPRQTPTHRASTLAKPVKTPREDQPNTRPRHVSGLPCHPTKNTREAGQPRDPDPQAEKPGCRTRE